MNARRDRLAVAIPEKLRRVHLRTRSQVSQQSLFGRLKEEIENRSWKLFNNVDPLCLVYTNRKNWRLTVVFLPGCRQLAANLVQKTFYHNDKGMTSYKEIAYSWKYTPEGFVTWSQRYDNTGEKTDSVSTIDNVDATKWFNSFVKVLDELEPPWVKQRISYFDGSGFFSFSLGLACVWSDFGPVCPGLWPWFSGWTACSSSSFRLNLACFKSSSSVAM